MVDFKIVERFSSLGVSSTAADLALPYTNQHAVFRDFKGRAYAVMRDISAAVEAFFSDELLCA
jgi:hypothetical protein